MRPFRPRSPEHRFVIANEEDFQRWLELVLEAERGRLRQANTKRNAEAATILDGASNQERKRQSRGASSADSLAGKNREN
jgi:hypothetical protein